MTSPDKKLAKDIATNLDRRRTGRRVLFLAVLAAAIVLAVMYLTCGRGLGIGGKGPGKGEGSATAVDAGSKRCMIRVTAAGIRVNGKPTTRNAAVKTCKAASGADVVVTGDARQGDWDDLRAALEAANIAIYKR